jgi:hypothetical protein
MMGICACSNSIERRTVVGRYTERHGSGVAVLDVKEDGTYDYVYGRGMDSLRLAGKWSFGYFEGEPRLRFENFLFGIPGYGTKVPGTWDVEVEKRLFHFGEISLCLDPDLGYYYVKSD